MNTTKKIDLFIIKEGNGNIRDALNVALVRLEDVTKTLKDLEYINIGLFGGMESFVDIVETKWRYCPSCGYKEPDGHWQDCELWIALEKLKDELS